MKDPCGALMIFVFIVMGGAFGFLFGGSHMQHKYQSEAVELGYAKYDAYTGQWQWNKKEDK